MDKKLENFLINLNFSRDDIENFCSRVPGLEIIDSERAFKNISILLAHGYPRADIDGLIFSNPAFLCNDPRDLDRTLKSLGDDIEELLKSNPFLI